MAQFRDRKTDIILIGSVCAGKSTQGKLLAESIDKKLVSLDAVGTKYYKMSGFKKSEYEKLKKDKGFLEAYRYWWPSLAYAAQKVLQDYSDCVIDFGAGHSHYEDKLLFENVKKALSEYSNVIFLLPSSNLEHSVSVIRARSIKNRGRDWRTGDYDFIEHWIKDGCNHNLATMKIYTEGKTPEETRDEILQNTKL